MRLTLEGINFAYGRRPVLQDINFHLEAGRILAVLGVNGAGKSTLLKCINGILRPLGGKVLLGEENLLELSRNQRAKQVGYVPQGYDQDQMTVFETVLLGCTPHIKWSPRGHDMLVVENALRMMNLEDVALRRVNELSGGETQKVILARAFAQKTQVLLMDEPTSNLDLHNQLEVMSLVRDTVRQQGLHALVAIHDLNLALRVADELLFLKDGKVHAFLPMADVQPGVIRDVYGVEAMVKNIEGVLVVIPFERLKADEAHKIA